MSVQAWWLSLLMITDQFYFHLFPTNWKSGSGRTPIPLLLKQGIVWNNDCNYETEISSVDNKTIDFVIPYMINDKIQM